MPKKKSKISDKAFFPTDEWFKVFDRDKGVQGLIDEAIDKFVEMNNLYRYDIETILLFFWFRVNERAKEFRTFK